MNELKQQLNIKLLNKIVARSFINIVDNSYEDIIGNYEQNELVNALLVCRTSVIDLMKAYIFSYDYSVDRNKWVYKKLCILSQNQEECMEIKERFEKLYVYPDVCNYEQLSKHIEMYIEFINDVINLISNRLGGI